MGSELYGLLPFYQTLKLNTVAYILINKTRKTVRILEGAWSEGRIKLYLMAGEKLVVISTYSNTLKIPTYCKEDDKITWEEFDIPAELLNHSYC